MSLPGGDKCGDERPDEDGDQGLVVDLPELAYRGEQHGEHDDEHAGTRRHRTHQLSPGER